jgi:hypothetical protein
VINDDQSDDKDNEDDVVDAEGPALARPCSCCGNAASNCDKVDCEFEPVELPRAWATAAAGAGRPRRGMTFPEPLQRPPPIQSGDEPLVRLTGGVGYIRRR